MTPHALEDTLISHAAGLTSDSAAAELICAHHTWLTRTDFAASYIHSGTSPGRPPYAYIDWEHAITALDSHRLSCTPSEAAILRIAASLGDHHIPVHLAHVLGSLDQLTELPQAAAWFPGQVPGAVSTFAAHDQKRRDAEGPGVAGRSPDGFAPGYWRSVGAVSAA